jgi:hypothetical protein
MHIFDVHLIGEAGYEIQAQVVQAHIGVSLSETLEEIYTINPDGRRQAEMLVIRLPVEKNFSSMEEAERDFVSLSSQPKDAFARAKDRSVHILGSVDGTLHLTHNINPDWDNDPLEYNKLTQDGILDAIRTAEMEYILANARAVLSLPRGAKFLAPSGREVQSFIRVGNIQYDRDAIDAVFFWLLPRLKDVGALLTDTWSISSIAFNISRLSAVYFRREPLPVALLDSYNDDSGVAKEKARRVIERLVKDHANSKLDRKTMLCLISATQTGSLAARLEEILHPQEKLETHFITLFRLGDSKLPTLHDLSKDERFIVLPEISNDFAAVPSAPIRIDPQTYFPLSFQDFAVELKKPVMDRSKGFFDRYAGTSLIQVHRDHQAQGDSPRHHAIYLATEKLMTVPAFVKNFEEKLKGLRTAPIFIVSPPHEAGKALARCAHEYFSKQGSPCPIFAHPSLYIHEESPLEEEKKLLGHLNNASEEHSILIVDDVFISGARLSQYQRNIRSLNYKGRIDYLIGVARPGDLAKWRNAKRRLSYRGDLKNTSHTVDAVEEVLLPDWQQNHCPWCVEKRLYQEWSAKHATMPDALLDRLEVLSRSTPEGLQDDLFLQFPEYAPFRIGPGSFFAPGCSSQSEVFAAVASALQYLRTQTINGQITLGPRRFPVATVLKHEDYLLHTWTDTILRASVLRAATFDELTYADPRSELQRTADLLRLLSQPERSDHEIALEVLLAANEGKCSLDGVGRHQHLLRSFGLSDVINFMVQQINEPKLVR